MAPLIADAAVTSKEDITKISYPVADNVHIYKGSLVCADTNGYANIGADTSGFFFLGVADNDVDNTVTGHTAGGKSITVLCNRAFLLTGSGFTQASVGTPVYVSDSATVAASSTNYILVGMISNYVSSTQVWVIVPIILPTASTGITGLTATAAELNKNHSVTAGTSRASSTLVLGASKNTDVLSVATLTASAALVETSAASVAYAATMALVVATPVITVAAVNGTSATATINCASVAAVDTRLEIMVTADSSGTCTITFGTGFKPSATLAVTASHFAAVQFRSNGTNWLEVGRSAIIAS